jgi:hypothetical protein
MTAKPVHDNSARGQESSDRWVLESNAGDTDAWDWVCALRR